jgi:hypothetical protein
VLFATDTQGAAIYAFEPGKAVAGAKPGTPDVAAIGQKIAAVLGTDAASITIAGLAIYRASKNAFISVTLGDHLATVRHQDCFAGTNLTQVFTSLFFKLPDPDAFMSPL